ncbi:MAG: FmdB family zinc ribbon protein [Spirochaetia bacterium]|jgi:putative FmdB family regulatory protein
MPIFEYECKDCRNAFELLVRSDTKIACPSCESERVVKKLSIFAAHSGKPDGEVPACHTGGHGCDLGKCGSGFCGVE